MVRKGKRGEASSAFLSPIFKVSPFFRGEFSSTDWSSAVRGIQHQVRARGEAGNFIEIDVSSCFINRRLDVSGWFGNSKMMKEISTERGNQQNSKPPFQVILFNR